MRRKVLRNVEPVWDTTKDATKKVVVISALAALIGGLWYLGHADIGHTGDDETWTEIGATSDRTDATTYLSL